MTILDKPPPEWKRPPIPCKVKLQVLITQEGRSTIEREKFGRIENTHFDHRPPLEQRRFDDAEWDTIPPANDPAFIEAITVKQHDVRTNGRGGSRRVTTAGSDTHVRGRTRRLVNAQAEHHAAMAAKAAGEPRPVSAKPKRKILSRPSPSKRRRSA
jgi:hypothetical protein